MQNIGISRLVGVGKMFSNPKRHILMAFNVEGAIKRYIQFAGVGHAGDQAT